MFTFIDLILTGIKNQLSIWEQRTGTPFLMSSRILLPNRHSEPVSGVICNFIYIFACYFLFSTCYLHILYINLDYQFLCLHVAICCFGICISIATCISMPLVILLYTFGCMYMPVACRTPWQISPMYGLKGAPIENKLCYYYLTARSKGM